MAKYGRVDYRDAIANATHYIAIGQTTIWLDETDAPWDKAETVEAGGAYRLSGPTGCRFTALEAGLALTWSCDFESRDANGRSVSLFDRDAMREIARKLPPRVRQKYADFLASEVLPAVAKRTAELREAMNQQADSEDCVRGIIAYAQSEPQTAAA